MKEEISIYQSETGIVEVRLAQNTVWLTQSQMVSLFGRGQSVVSRHISKIFRVNWRGKAICKKCILQIQTSRCRLLIPTTKDSLVVRGKNRG